MSSLSLEEFIYQVKGELLEAQRKHEGELAYLELQNVELEVSVVVSKKANGKVNIYVAEIGSDVSKEQVQRVKLAFNVVDPQSEVASPRKGTKVSEAENKSSRVVRRGKKYR